MRNASFLLLAGLALGGCQVFGGRAAPDEFAVARNAPLVIPPDFGLTPPRPGQTQAIGSDSRTLALQALFGGPAPRSAAEMSLLERAGRDRAAIGARSTAGDPNTRIVDKGTVTAAILAAPQSDAAYASSQVPQ